MNKTKHPLYSTWAGIKYRTANKSDTRYGGRGITCCQRWLDNFWNFVEDMGERPDGCSIDRIDNNKGYSPDNCKWSTPSEQSYNRRARIKGKHKGYYQKPDGKFIAQTSIKGRTIHIGTYKCPLVAHLAYKDYINTL